MKTKMAQAANAGAQPIPTHAEKMASAKATTPK
jgi:hypothetical protein